MHLARTILTRTAGIAALTATAVAATATAALADDFLGRATCDHGRGEGCEVTAKSRGGSPSGAPSGSASQPPAGPGGLGEGSEEPVCRYERAKHVGPLNWDPPKGKAKEAKKGGGWYWQFCRLGDGEEEARRVWLAPGEDGQPSVDPMVVARMARDRLRLPAPRIHTSPPVDEQQLVNLPTWAWLDSDTWEDRAASASLPGITVTATAEPSVARWRWGDGSTSVCDGPGVPFRKGTDPRRASPDCGHTYRHSSAGQPDGALEARVRVTWRVRWSGGGQSGVLPALTTTDTAAVRVAESHGLVTD